jgi:hypothetical protein
MLSMDETTEKESEPSTNDDNAWDGFQCKLLGYIFQWTCSVSYVATISLSVALPL